MPEYAGYVPTESINWLSLAKGVKTDIDQGLKVREDKKAEDEKLFSDAKNKLSSWESTQSQPFNEFAFKGLDNARQQSMVWNRQLKSGEITRSEYQRRMNNLNDSFDAFTTASKNLDSYVTSINKAIQDGEASSHMVFSAQLNSDLMNIGNKKLEVGDNGDFFVVGNDGTYQNVRNYTNMNNIYDKKINVNEVVENATKDWEPWLTKDVLEGGASITTEDARLNKEFYNNAKADIIGSIVDPSNPRAVVSVLLDNSNLNYQEYYTEQQKIDLINKAISNRELAAGKQMTEEEKAQFADEYSKNNLIQVVQDNEGKYQPVLTDKIIKDAQSVVNNAIEMRFKRSVEEERGFAPSRNDGGGKTEAQLEREKEKQAVGISGYKATLRAFGMDENAVKQGKTIYNRPNDFSGLSRSYQYKKVPDGIAIYKAGDVMYDPNTDDSDGATFVAKNPRDLAQYVFGGQNVAESQMKYEKARSEYLQGSTPKQIVKPKNTTIKSSDIPAKAKASGYTTEEYKKLLKEKGIKII